MEKREREKLVLEANERQNRAQSLLTQSKYYANLKNWKAASDSAQRMLELVQDYATTLKQLEEGTN
jgi:hypothetical protein